MPQENKICQHGHCHAGVISLNDRVGIKLAAASGAQQLELPAVRKCQPLGTVSAHIFNNGLHACADGYHVRIIRVPYVHTLWRCQHREASQISLYTDSLNLLYAALEVPGPVCVPQYAAPLRVVLPALCPEQQGFFYRYRVQAEVWRRHLCHAGQVVIVVILPLIKGFLCSDRQLGPSDQPVVILAI